MTDPAPIVAPRGFPPGSVVQVEILAVLLPMVDEVAAKTGRSPFAALVAAATAGLILMGAKPVPGIPS